MHPWHQPVAALAPPHQGVRSNLAITVRQGARAKSRLPLPQAEPSIAEAGENSAKG